MSEAEQIKALSRDRLHEEFDDFVRSIAIKLRRSLRIQISEEDVISLGWEGLLEAHDRYDVNSNARFTSYAYYRIRGAILDGCRREGWLPRSRRRRGVDPQAQAKQMSAVNDLMEARCELEQDRPPARTFNDAINRVSDQVGDALTVLLVSREDLEGMEVVDPSEPADERVERLENRSRALEAIEEILTDNERKIVVGYYYRGETMTELAAREGRTRSWASRQHTSAIAKLRDRLRDDDG